MKWLLPIFGVLIMITTSGCANSNNKDVSLPGNPELSDYATDFDIDWDVFESGTYVYGLRSSMVRRIGGIRDGYRSFYDLTLDFKFKDGRKYHEKIDVKSLIIEMVKNHEIHDLRADKWGGMTTLKIRIKSNKLIIYYVVSERIKEDNPINVFSKRYSYPVFEKTFY